MTGFDAIIGQELPIRLLRTLIQKGTVPHALLFTGMAGVGKKTGARAFAMALNCEAPNPDNPAAACGRCRTCRQIGSGTHPDVVLIEPRGAYLRIDQIRSLLTALSMKAFSASHRVAIIAEAQQMNVEAGNALLKVLEEPPEGTFIIITALTPSDLLPTIVSRCRHIRFGPLTQRELVALLTKNDGLSVEQAETAAHMAAGSYTKAQRFVQNQWRQRRDWLVRAAGLDDAAHSRETGLRMALAFSDVLTARKDGIDDVLEILMAWIRDLSILPYAPEQVANIDCLEMLRQARSGISQNQLFLLWDALAGAQKDIAANANLRLTLDAMALKLAAARASDHAWTHLS